MNDWYSTNDQGVWCDFCGEHLIAEWESDGDGNYATPEYCKTCGAPDMEDVAAYFEEL